jgi:hypothetical protein
MAVHRIKNAPSAPDARKQYKAQVSGVTIAWGKIVWEWTIYTPRTRQKKGGTKRAA